MVILALPKIFYITVLLLTYSLFIFWLHNYLYYVAKEKDYSRDLRIILEKNIDKSLKVLYPLNSIGPLIK